MADSKPQKRLVKNPETFRERAVKASQPEKPSRFKSFFRLLAMPLKIIFGPPGRTLKRLINLRPLRWLKVVFQFIGRVLLPRYIRNSWRELRLVNWPGWKESRRLTFAVIAFAIIFGAAVASVDYGLDKVFKHILLK